MVCSKLFRFSAYSAAPHLEQVPARHNVAGENDAGDRIHGRRLSYAMLLVQSKACCQKSCQWWIAYWKLNLG